LLISNKTSLFPLANIDIPQVLSRRRKKSGMHSNRTRQILLITLLLAISIITLAPSITHASQQPPTNPITINATGTATAINNGPSGPTTLSLKANAYTAQNHWLMIQNATGTLTIGSSTFDIVNGQGSVNTYGDLAIFASTNASSSQSELILHGSVTGTSVSFDPPSQLVSSANLSLTGTLNQNSTQAGSALTGTPGSLAANSSQSSTASMNRTTTNATSPSASATMPTQNATHASVANVTTASANSTQAASLQLQNSTQSSTRVGTSALVNSTVTPGIAPQNATQTYTGNATTLNNSTAVSALVTNNATQSSLMGNGNPSVNASAGGNSTVTVTQYSNETVVTTSTVASLTISYTTTVTVANTTVTRANATTTITATTGP